MVGPAVYDFLSLRRANHFGYCCLRACVCTCVCIYMCVCVFVCAVVYVCG